LRRPVVQFSLRTMVMACFPDLGTASASGR
jgi:hypothetical protein